MRIQLVIEGSHRKLLVEPENPEEKRFLAWFIGESVLRSDSKTTDATVKVEGEKTHSSFPEVTSIQVMI